MARLELRPRTPALAILLGLVLTLLACATAGATERWPTATETTPPPPTETTPSPAPPPETTTPSSTPAPSEAPSAEPAPSQPPQVQTQHPQGATRSNAPARRGSKAKSKGSHGGQGANANGKEANQTAGTRGGRKAVAPSALTPGLPLTLQTSLTGVPSFFIESFRIPPFLLPIYQAAGTAYGIPWQVLAAINEVETDYGRDLSVSSAGAEGWMQFLPSSWALYGVDANGDGYRDPYNPADAIFAAARYLRAAGGQRNIKAAVFSYNHSQAYVESVILRAQLLGGTPLELLGAVTGLTEAHFPVHAAAHFSDGFPTVGSPARTIPGTVIYAEAGAPVIAVQDGEVVQIGSSPALGRFLRLRDAFGNTYTYAQLGSVAGVYPVLAPHVHSTVSPRVTSKPEPAPSGPATAGAQARSPLSQAGTVSALALGAAAPLEAAPGSQPATPGAQPATPSAAKPHGGVHVFRSGSNDVYLHDLRAGVQVIAGTVLGHVGADAGALGSAVAPHLLFQVRPAGQGAPLIDPKPILDGWVALENTSIFRAKGENPFLATSPTIGQVLLESKQQLAGQVLHDGGIRLGRCGRADVTGGRVDRRVLALLEYLSVSGLKPSVAGLKCSAGVAAAQRANVAAGQSSSSVDITAINGVALAGHDGRGSIAEETVRKLLMLQGVNRPRRILSALAYPGSGIARSSSRIAGKIRIAFGREDALAAGSGRAASILTPSGWIRLTSRLGEIPDPTVGRGPSPAAIPDSTSGAGSTNGNH